LDERAKPNGGLPIEEVSFIGAQLTMALEALHPMRILHRDIKPNNVLLRHDGYVALTDFGLCATLPPHGQSGELPSGRAGTRGFWAPEVVLKQAQDEAADWWSLGVLLSYAATGSHPFHQRWLHRGDEAAVLPSGVTMPPADVYDDDVVPPAEGGGAGLLRKEQVVEANVEAIDEVLGSAVVQPLAPQPPVLGSASKQGGDELRTEPRVMSDEAINFSTLYMPLPPSAHSNHSALSCTPLGALLDGMLTRDASQRLGAPPGGASDVRGHAFFRGVEWKLLLQRAIPAPFVPDASLVYAKDHLVPLSQDERETLRTRHEPPPRDDEREEGAEQQPLELDGWDYVCTPEAYTEELAEMCATRPDKVLKAPMLASAAVPRVAV
jgi:serine/threonine protein kinase